MRKQATGPDAERRHLQMLAKKAASGVTGVPVSQMKRGSHPVVGARNGKTPPKKGARSVMGNRP